MLIRIVGHCCFANYKEVEMVPRIQKLMGSRALLLYYNVVHGVWSRQAPSSFALYRKGGELGTETRVHGHVGLEKVIF